MLAAQRPPSPTATTSVAQLTQLSRNASVISSSSSSSSSSSLSPDPPLTPTQRSRPRAFSPPRIRRRSNNASQPTPDDHAPLAAAAALAAVRPKPHLAMPPRGMPTHADNGPPTPRATTAAPRQLAVRADFDFGDSIGDGSYSEVVKATHKATGKVYAIKCMSKMHLVRKDKIKYANSERDALVWLTQGGHEGVIHLYWTFQDTPNLYFVLSYASNGNMQSLIRSYGSLSLRCARYYIAQLVDTITWIHSKGVIHRDVKPENLLLDDLWRLKLGDFGSAKLLRRGQDGAFVEDHENTRSFVGSPQYVSPELLLDQYKYACKSSDLYACGCILFEMLTGQFLFSAFTEFLTFQKIKQGEHTAFPDWLDSRAADFIRALLPLNPAERLGAKQEGGPDAIKAHPFFSDARPDEGLLPIEWSNLWKDAGPLVESGQIKASKPPPPTTVVTDDWDGYNMTSSDFAAVVTQTAAGASALSLSDDVASEEADGVAHLDVVPTAGATSTRPAAPVRKNSTSSTRRRSSAASSNGSKSTILAALGAGLLSRRGSASHSSDGTASSGDHAIASGPVVSVDQIQQLLAPQESLSHFSRVHIRREILRGLVRKDKPVVLCLTSGQRLVALQASTRRGWRIELVLHLGSGRGANSDEKDSSEASKATDTVDTTNYERGERVLRIEPSQDDCTFILRTSSQTHTFVAPDAQAAARWSELLSESMATQSTRT